jgi:hypothetical protein
MPYALTGCSLKLHVVVELELPRCRWRWFVGAEIAGSERETRLADVGCDRPLTNLLRNPCGIAPTNRRWAPPRRHRWASWRAYESPVVLQLIHFQV